jgi:hypothetical protein
MKTVKSNVRSSLCQRKRREKSDGKDHAGMCESQVGTDALASLP